MLARFCRELAKLLVVLASCGGQAQGAREVEVRVVEAEDLILLARFQDDMVKESTSFAGKKTELLFRGGTWLSGALMALVVSLPKV